MPSSMTTNSTLTASIFCAHAVVAEPSLGHLGLGTTHQGSSNAAHGNGLEPRCRGARRGWMRRQLELGKLVEKCPVSREGFASGAALPARARWESRNAARGTERQGGCSDRDSRQFHRVLAICAPARIHQRDV